MAKDFRKLAQIAARAAADKKAVNPVVWDMRHTSDLADYIVVAGAESSAQMRAIEDSVEEALKAGQLRLLRRDGRPKDRWLVLDYGGLIMHILLPEARDFYRLEQMWEDARQITWEEKVKALPAKKVKSKRPTKKQ